MGRSISLPLHLQKEDNTDRGLHLAEKQAAFVESQSPSLQWQSSTQRNSQSGKPFWNRMIRGRIFHCHPFVFRLPVNMPQHCRKSQWIPPEIIQVAGFISASNCFLLRGYYHCESGGKNRGDQRLTIDYIWSRCRRNKATVPSITHRCAICLPPEVRRVHLNLHMSGVHFLTVVALSPTNTP